MGSADVQGELWGRDPQAWARLQEPQMRPIYDATLDALEPLAGTALLDAGCGVGLVVALAVGRGAAVSGLDASAPLLQVARARTPGADLRTGDIEALPYCDASFDIVTAFNAIQHATDRPQPSSSWPGSADPAAKSPSGSGATPTDARPRHCSPGCARSPRPRRASPRHRRRRVARNTSREKGTR